MKKPILFVATLSIVASLAAAVHIDLHDIVNREYIPQFYNNVHPMSDGEHYTRMSDDGHLILRYSFKDGEVTDTLFNTATARGCNFKKFDGYTLSPDEKNILIQTDTHPIYRRSFTAVHYLYNIKNNKMEPLSSGGPQQVPLFSPDGSMVAFVRDNNIFLVKLLFNNSESQVTTDGERGKILNGIPDWANEEEFTVTRSFDFSADSKMLAYIRYDESQVPSHTIQLYNSPYTPNNDYAQASGTFTYKYPVAGAPLSKTSVQTFDIKTRVTRRADIPMEEGEGYIPRIIFTDEADKLLSITLNRHQNRMDLYSVNPRSGIAKLILREESEQYIEEKAYRDLTLYPGHFILQSERSGHNHLYLYTLNGSLVRRITDGAYEVTALQGWEQKSNTFYYTSNEGSPLRTALYKINAKGEKTKLTPGEGINSALFSKNLKYFINSYSNLTTPPQITLHEQSGKEIRVLEDNSSLVEKLSKTILPQKELFTFTTADGIELNGWMMKPGDFNQNKKYPVILYQYSGPGSQEVKDSWSCGFFAGGILETYLADKGFIVVCVDGRGTGGRGARFGKSNYMGLGTLEAQDQVETAHYLSTLPYIDGKNIGIWGWSYGGYNTLMSMSSGNPVFKAGVAVAPLTDWRNYNAIYTERYMRTPKENGEGYNSAAPILQAGKLNGKLLLMHGTADDNVHLNNTIEYAGALVAAGKEYELLLYPNSNHSIYKGSNTRFYLFSQMARFFSENLK